VGGANKRGGFSPKRKKKEGRVFNIQIRRNRFADRKERKKGEKPIFSERGKGTTRRWGWAKEKKNSPLRRGRGLRQKN